MRKKEVIQLSEEDILENIHLADEEKELSLPLFFLLSNPQFKKEWPRIQTKLHGKFEKDWEIKKLKEYNCSPEKKRRNREYYRRPEVIERRRKWYKEKTQSSTDKRKKIFKKLSKL